MRILMLGATGRLGERALAEALDRGHTVTVVDGDGRDRAALAAALPGHDALISCVGPGQADSDPDAISLGVATILAEMGAAGLRRIVAVADAGILQADEETLLHAMPDFPPARRALAAAHLRAYALLRAAGARWTLACLPQLTDGVGTGGYRAERDYLPEGGAQIAYADAALFLLDELESGAFVGSRVGIAD